MRTTTGSTGPAAKAAMARTREDEFPLVEQHVSLNFAAAKPPFFRTKPEKSLYKTYLRNFAAGERRTHECHACQRFIERFGALVTIDAAGTKRSVFWSETAPSVYRKSVAAMARAVEESPIEDVFLSPDSIWGTGREWDDERSVYWNHFLVHNKSVFAHPLLSAEQVMAEKREECKMLARAVADYPIEKVRTAVALLKGEQLYRGEKTLGVAEWFLGLLEELKAHHYTRRDNVIWTAVAEAPAGFAHIRASMIGTLLDDLAQGLSIETVKRRFAEKMNPLQYQRAQVPPKAGNVAAAEKVVEQLHAAGSLQRRFARLEDLELLWQPRVTPAPRPRAGGMFSHLVTRSDAAQVVSDVYGTPAITWEKFARTVLPSAEKIEYLVPVRGDFIALVTAARPFAPPILQWDVLGRRNPVSWYVYNGQSAATQWNITPRAWAEVSGVTLLPPMWGPGPHLDHQGQGAILLLRGARDLHHRVSGGFFTEMLKSEYHGVRSTLEAFMMKEPIAEKEAATACGADLRKGKSLSATVRVTAGDLRSTYVIDRWD